MNKKIFLKSNFQNGFTLIEALISITIIIVLVAVVSYGITAFKEGQALNNTVDEVTALLNQARSRTLAGDGGVAYGVRLESTKATLISNGTLISPVITFSSGIVLNSISLTGGGSDVTFNKLTGDTNQYGTFIVKKASTTAGQKTVTITKTGAVSSN
jgi:type II secretory pathway pseudopilin PulG